MESTMSVEEGKNEQQQKQNRITLSAFDWIGFDLDHTIARYNHDVVNPLIFDSLRQWLVANRDYDASLLDVEYNSDFAIKGLVFDKKNGMFIIVNDQKVISTSVGYHGTRCVHMYHSHKDKDSAYRGDTKLEGHIYPGAFDEFDKEAGLSWADDATEIRFHTFLTNFDIPSAYLHALLIDLVDRKEHVDENGELVNAYYVKEGEKGQHQKPDVRVRQNGGYHDVHNDIIAAYSAVFSDDNSLYHSQMREQTAKYIPKRPRLAEWLGTFVDGKHGKGATKTFLVTNSPYNYARVLCEHLFGSEWTRMFSCIIVRARKPRFFLPPDHPSYVKAKQEQERIPSKATSATKDEDTKSSSFDMQKPKFSSLMPSFILLHPATGQPVQEIEAGQHSQLKLFEIYQGGNSYDFTRFAARISGKPVEDLKVIYWGDNMKTDVMAVKLNTTWLAGAILEEVDERSHSERHAHIPDKETGYCATFSSPLWGSFFDVGIDFEGHANEFQYWDLFLRKHSAVICGDCDDLIDIDFNEHIFSYDYESDVCYLRMPTHRKHTSAVNT